ncbi:GNAT family N-acetyltransferase [Nonomuraea jiangxiensis]|uniref:Acetyltransferase (GNAT) family protein n=1 Tax=Nonomuraea jiangxiensis TaxID=633440 RepID=A0A1G9LN91_9ACTN|nr:GNAT family N-acetyltransferase [Nonomuraea jiangxiensis]SDL63472.1 Acetyltransferase (GNAT) family protein [Nonomuraea jiangxiensis]
MTIKVEPATPEHIEALVGLLEEMDRYYGADELDSVEVRTRQVQQALFTEPRAAFVLLAWQGDQLVGVASYSFLWPAVGLTRSLYLKELYVSESAQRQGVGTALMKALFALAVEHGCSRVEWTTDHDNVRAQQFYEGLGQNELPTKLFYRVVTI